MIYCRDCAVAYDISDFIQEKKGFGAISDAFYIKTKKGVLKFLAKRGSKFSTVSGIKYYDISSPTGVIMNEDIVSFNEVSYDGEEIQFLRNPEHIEGY